MAAERGTRVHEHCSAVASGLWISAIEDGDVNYVESFKKWFSFYVMHVECNEKRMYCDEMQFTGQCDLIVRLKGDEGLTLVDIKTCSRVEKTHLPQLSAYIHLANQSGHRVRDAQIVRLKKTGAAPEVKKYTSEELDMGWKLFESAYKWFRYLTF